MKFELIGLVVSDILVGLQYEQHWLKVQRSTSGQIDLDL